MRRRHDCFHLAIPVDDLDRAVGFYVSGLGCKLARRYEDRVTLDFFGDQVVCHLTENTSETPVSLYPRHFGATFERARDFELLHELCLLRKLPFFRALNTRFDGRAEVHRTFVLQDPAGNLIEFKHYRDPRMMY